MMYVQVSKIGISRRVTEIMDQYKNNIINNRTWTVILCLIKSSDLIRLCKTNASLPNYM